MSGIEIQRLFLGIHGQERQGTVASGQTLPVQRGLSTEFLAEQGLFNLERVLEIACTLEAKRLSSNPAC